MASHSDPAPFASVLRQHRLAAHLTQEALAERAGMSTRGIQNLESGVTRPYRDSAQRLAAALHLTGEGQAAFLAVAEPAPRHTRSVAIPIGQARHNLPVFLTSFVGREAEIAELRERLTETRLLTLTGTGGCGKSRLAMEVARGVTERYPDGVWQVELAGLSDPAVLPQAVAAAVGVRVPTSQDLVSVLGSALRRRQVLVLLDNCEHLLDACAALVDRLVSACPELTVLITSRQPLGVRGEVGWRVPALAVPDLAALPPLAVLGGCEAVRLFVARAEAARPGFALTARNARAVAQLCTRLDGLPLALELAAARVTALSVEELVARLEDRFHLLSNGGRTAWPRQRTLRATLDWSYDLLAASERTLFARLAVFAGTWSLEAAEAVGAGDGLERRDVLAALCRLVDQSLVAVREDSAGDTRYTLPETIRDYAMERLAASGEEEAVRARHAACYLQLAQQAGMQIGVAGMATQFHRLAVDLRNLHAALTFFVDRGLAEPALLMVGHLGSTWNVRGQGVAGRDLLAETLALPGGQGPSAARAWALRGAASAACKTGGTALARRYFEEHVAVTRSLGDRAGEAEGLDWLALFARMGGDLAAAQHLWEQSLELARAVGDQGRIATVIERLGENALYQGDASAARRLFEQPLAIYQELSDTWGIAGSLITLGQAAWALGEHTEARAQFTAALALQRAHDHQTCLPWTLHELGGLDLEHGDLAGAHAAFAESLSTLVDVAAHLDIPLSVGDFAALAAARGEPARALRLAGAASSLRELMPDFVMPRERALLASAEQCGRDALGELAAAAALAEGRAMSLDEAIAYALEDHKGTDPF